MRPPLTSFLQCPVVQEKATEQGSGIALLCVALITFVLGVIFGIFLNIMMDEINVVKRRQRAGKQIELCVDSRSVQKTEECFKHCVHSAETNPTRRPCTDKAVQSQCTYTYVLKHARSKFEVLPERSSGVS